MKKRLLRLTNVLLLPLLFLLLMAMSFDGKAQTLTLDQADLDYSPGETVFIAGTGFGLNETVEFSIIHLEPYPDPYHPHDIWTTTSDESGKIASYWYVDVQELNTRLLLTAKGLTSGITKSIEFTDTQPTGSNCSVSSISVSGCPQNITVCANALKNGVAGVYYSPTWNPPSFTVNFTGDCNITGDAFQMSFDLNESRSTSTDCWFYDGVQRTGTDGGKLKLWQSVGSLGNKICAVTSPFFYLPATPNIGTIKIYSPTAVTVKVSLANTNIVNTYSLTGNTSLQSLSYSITPATAGNYRLIFQFEYTGTGNAPNSSYVDLITLDANLAGSGCIGDVNYSESVTGINTDNFYPVGTHVITYTANYVVGSTVVSQTCSFSIVVQSNGEAPSATTPQIFCSSTNPTIASLWPAAGTTIKWYNVATDGTALESTTTLATGTYWVSQIGLNGCESFRTPVAVTINQTPAALFLTGSTVCEGALGTITSSTSVVGINYQLYNSANAAVQSTVAGTGNALTWSGIAAGNGYYVKGTNATTGCASASSNAVNVAINSLPTCQIQINGTHQVGTEGQIAISPLSTIEFCAPEGMTYEWTGPYLTNDQKDDRCITVNDPGTYSVKITNGSGCSSTCSVVLEYLPQASNCDISATATVCPGSTTQYTASAVANGFTYEWSILNNDPDGSISGSTTAQAASIVAGTTCGGTFSVILKIFNATGHEVKTCQIDVSVVDNTDPAWAQAMPGDVTVECDAVPTVPTIAATDNCDTQVDIAYTQVRTDGACPNSYTLTRKWVATDNCSHSIEHVQTITVQDNTNPTIVCPTLPTDGFKRSTNAGLCTYSVVGTEFNATATDNCSATVGLTWKVTAADNTVQTRNTTLDNVALKLGINTIEWTAEDACGNKSSCSFTVNVNQVISDITLITVEAVPAPAIPITPAEQQYSDQVKLSATVAPAGCIEKDGSFGTMTFKIGSQVMGTVDVQSDGTATLTDVLLEDVLGQGTMSPGLKTITAIYTPVSGAQVTGKTEQCESCLKITQEDAIVNYTGVQITGEADPNVNTTPVTLRATITDDPDGNRGDIRNALVRFYVDGNAVSGLLTPVLISPADLTQGMVSFLWNAPVPSTGYNDYSVEAKVEGYYKDSNNASDNQTVLTVYRTSLAEFITGGGHIIPVDSKGEYASDPGRKVNFGFNIKWNKSVKNLQGHMNIIFRRGDQVYQIKTTAMSSLGIDPTDPCSHKAVFTSKANLSNVTNSAEPVAIYGGLQLQVTITDNGEPGVTDMIGITLYNGSTLVYSSSWPVSTTEELTLVGGNILVHDGLICNASDITHTVITSSKNPSLTGDKVAFTASVYGYNTYPEGTVQWFVGGKPVGIPVPLTVIKGVAVALFEYTFIDANSYEITANYTSTNGYRPSSGSLTQLVDGTSLVITSSKNPSVVNDPVIFQAKVGGIRENGTEKIQFIINDVPTGALQNVSTDGLADIEISNLQVGSNKIAANYSVNGEIKATTSIIQVVNNVAITLTSSKATVAIDESVTFTAVVNGGYAGKTVEFTIDGTPGLPVTVDALGIATTTASFSNAGTHTIKATLSDPAVFATINQVVKEPTLVLSSSKNPSASGESVTFTANVSGGSGDVIFTSGSASASVSPNSSGVATWTNTFTTGSFVVTATYSGISNSLTQVVNGALPITVNLAVSPTVPAAGYVFGTNLTFTATVNNSLIAPTGTITFKDGATILKVVTVSGGKASFATNKLAVGTHSITATYDLTKATSNQLSFTITAKTTKSAEIVTEVSPILVEPTLKAYPNPFTDRLNIEFSPATDGMAKLEIYGVTGAKLATLFNGPVEAGVVYFNEYVPTMVSSQMVFYHLTIDGKTQVGKAIFQERR